MLEPDNDLVPPPSSSPSISSSVSSSDLDTQSTGSFFHDRSTTLGTLMGLNFPPISLRVSSRRETNNNAASVVISGGGSADVGIGDRKTLTNKERRRRRKKVVVVEAAASDRRRPWWKLCRDDVATPASLGEFLQVERRLSDAEFYGTAAVEGYGNGNRRLLFADGRVLPPPSTPPSDGAHRRFPILLTGICSGGGGGAQRS